MSKKAILILSLITLFGCDQNKVPDIQPQEPSPIEKKSESPVKDNTNGGNKTLSLADLQKMNAGVSSIPSANSNSNIIQENKNISQNVVVLSDNDPLNSVNMLRNKVRIGLLSLNSSLNYAAEKHALYVLKNKIASHDEDSTRPYFFGKTPSERVNKSNYSNGVGFTVGEVLTLSDGDSNDSLDKLVRAIYHRLVLLDPIFNEVGISKKSENGSHVFEMVLGARSNNFLSTAPRYIVAYPYNQQQEVPYLFFSNEEIPNPVPEKETVGFPISMQVTSGYTLKTISFNLRDNNGNIISGKELTPENDRHLESSQYAFIPWEPLKPNTLYKASYQGIINNIQKVDYTWTFTTKPQPEMKAFANKNILNVGDKLSITYSTAESKKVTTNMIINGSNEKILKLTKEEWGILEYEVLPGCLDRKGCAVELKFTNESGLEKSLKFMINYK